MQNRSFLTPILLFLCLIVICIIGAGVVTSIDRQRFQTEALTKAVSELSERIDRLSAGGGFVVSGVPGALSGEPPAGNAEFYDPKAEPGGRFISSISSDTGNMNMLINNDAIVSDFWSLTCDSLAERHFKDIDRFVPRMAESWSLSDDKLTYHISAQLIAAVVIGIAVCYAA